MTIPIKADFFKRQASSHNFMSAQFGVQKSSKVNPPSVTSPHLKPYAQATVSTCKLQAHNSHQAKDGKSHQMIVLPILKLTTARPLMNHSTAGISGILLPTLWEQSIATRFKFRFNTLLQALSTSSVAAPTLGTARHTQKAAPTRNIFRCPTDAIVSPLCILA